MVLQPHPHYKQEFAKQLGKSEEQSKWARPHYMNMTEHGTPDLLGCLRQMRRQSLYKNSILEMRGSSSRRSQPTGMRGRVIPNSPHARL